MNHPHFSRLLFFVLLSALLTSLESCKPQKTHDKAAQGYLDLSAWNLERDGSVALDGQWHFYWNKLYSPAELDSGNLPYSNMATVPGKWIDKDNGAYPSKGFGTYHLRVKLDRSYPLLAIKMLDEASGYKLWINRKLVASNGVVSSKPEEMEAQFLPLIKTFAANADTLDIVVQVANNFQYKAGLWESIKIGTQEEMLMDRERNALFNIFLVGAMLMLFCYHFWIYLLHRGEKVALWFAIACFFISVRVVFTGERFWYYLFPHFSLNVGLRIEYLTMVINPLVFSIYLYYLFDRNFSKRILQFIIAVVSAEMLLIIFTPTIFYTRLIVVYQVLVLLGILYLAVFLIRSIMRQRTTSPVRFYVSVFIFAIMVAGFVNDVLYAQLIINTTYLSPFGFVVFMLSQAYLLAHRMADDYTTIQNISTELNKSNINLESRVKERTAELSEEKKKSDELLLNILPEEVADELKRKGSADAKLFEDVTVLFTDFKSFTKVSESLSPRELVLELDTCFKAFDNIISKYNIEKIKTVGDAYMAASGLPTVNNNHASDTVKAALEIRDFMVERRRKLGDRTFEIRIGLNSGKVVAGIVGVKKFAYDIWGDTVNTAARMEQNSEAGKVNISEATHELVRDQFEFEYRGEVEAKNKGMLKMYFVENKH